MAKIKAPPKVFPSLTALTALSTIDTTLYMDGSFVHPKISSIEQYVDKTAKLNTLITPATFDETLANLIFLGHFSAMESYFRAIIRNIILIDPVSQEKSNKCMLTYGAAVHHSLDMLPDALLEQVSFTGKKNVIDTIRNYLDIIEGGIPMELKILLDEFDKVCQLRHCIVHRFSMFGSQNAIHLGLGLHNKLIEKPIKLDYAKLQTLIQTLDLTVKSFNNFFFKVQFERGSWKWSYIDDKSNFLKLFNIFQNKNSALTKPFPVYDAIRKAMK